MDREHEKRIQISCGETGDQIAAINKAVTALMATEGNEEEIREVWQLLHTRVGWPLNVVDEHLKLRPQKEPGGDK